MRRLVEDHLTANVDRGRALWTLLALEVWHRLYLDDNGTQAAANRLAEELGGAQKKGRELWEVRGGHLATGVSRPSER
jgi:hypothetical protein